MLGEAHLVKFSRLGLGLAGLAALATAAAGVAQTGSGPAGPVPAVLAQVGSTPAPTPSGPPQRGRRGRSEASPTPAASASESPPPLQFSSLDGIWEVEAQPIGRRTEYSHLSLNQTGNQLTGYWEHDPNKTRSPLTGTFDGRLFALSIDLGGGKTATMSGYSENFSDFVGMLHLAPNDPGTPFTAEHRRKERPT